MRETFEITVRLNVKQQKQAEEIAEMAGIDAAQAVQIIVNRNLPALHGLFINGLPGDDEDEEEDEE